MVDFAPKTEVGSAKGSLPRGSAEHQSPPTIYLQHHHLEKLGMKEMPKVGSKIKISGLAHVGSTNESNDQSGEGSGPRRSMTLHMHKMEVGKDGNVGSSDVEQAEESKSGAKAEMDKALARGMGGKKTKQAEGAQAKGGGD